MKHNYAGVWMLLAIALVVVLTFAFSDDFTIGSWTPKKAPYREALLSSREAEMDMTDPFLPDTLELTEIEEIVTDSLPQSILLFGDSMTYNLALRLAKYAKQNGHEFHAVNWDSSNTKTWSGCDTLDYYLDHYNVTYVFVSLGANEAYLKKPEVRRPEVETILRKIGDRPYVWIGPPNWKEDLGLNRFLASVCRPGSFFLTGQMELKRRKDGIHPTQDASALWVDSIMRWLPKSGHPILADVPSDTLGKANADIILLKAQNK